MDNPELNGKKMKEAKAALSKELANSIEIGLSDEAKKHVERRGRPRKADGRNDLFNFNFKLRRNLADSFRKICWENGLSSHGVMRDLVIAFIVANTDEDLSNIMSGEREAFMKENEEAKKAARNTRKSLTPEKIQAKILGKKPVEISKKSRALLEPNPFSGVDIFDELFNDIEQKRKDEK